MKGVSIALLVSLGINIALVGFMAGRIAGGAPVRSDPPAAHGRILDRASPAVRALMRDAFVEGGRRATPARRIAMQRRAELKSAILAEPFDRARVEAAFAAFREAEEGVRQIHGATVIDVLAKLPLEERKLLAHALARSEGPAQGRIRRGFERAPRRAGHGEPPPDSSAPETGDPAIEEQDPEAP